MSIGKISLLFALLAVVCRASADSNISASDGFAGDSEREAIYGALKNAESALKFAPFTQKPKNRHARSTPPALQRPKITAARAMKPRPAMLPST